MRHLKKMELIKESKGISAYDGVWVPFKYGDTDITEIFLNKSDAQQAADKLNDSLKPFLHINKTQYKVMSLDDAIYQIKEYVKNEEYLNSRNNEEY